MKALDTLNNGIVTSRFYGLIFRKSFSKTPS